MARAPYHINVRLMYVCDRGEIFPDEFQPYYMNRPGPLLKQYQIYNVLGGLSNSVDYNYSLEPKNYNWVKVDHVCHATPPCHVAQRDLVTRNRKLCTSKYLPKPAA